MAEVIKPMLLEHGERFAKLTVLRKVKKSHLWKVGCVCGVRFEVSARKLMRGEVKACRTCSGRSTR